MLRGLNPRTPFLPARPPSTLAAVLQLIIGEEEGRVAGLKTSLKSLYFFLDCDWKLYKQTPPQPRPSTQLAILFEKGLPRFPFSHCLSSHNAAHTTGSSPAGFCNFSLVISDLSKCRLQRPVSWVLSPRTGFSRSGPIETNKTERGHFGQTRPHPVWAETVLLDT